jgi:hypothetical protein
VRYFDFESALVRRLEAAKNEEERLMARTIVGKEEFGPAADRARLRVLQPGDHLELPVGPYLIIGVATWSDPDIAALDSAVDRIRAGRIPTCVFDIDECQSSSDMHTLLPQTDMHPTRTPIFAYYMDGKLQTFGQGHDAVHWLQQL